MAGTTLSHDEYQAAVDDLDKLCRSEYDAGLVDILQDEDRDLTLERLRRLTGILLKRPFGAATTARKEETATGANFYWDWQFDRLFNPLPEARPQYDLLVQIVTTPSEQAIGIPDDQLQGRLGDLAERGVYKVLALWIKDKLKGDETKSFREYTAQPESAEFHTLLNIADWASQGVIGTVLASTVGVPAVVVSLGLIMGKYGYQKLVEERDGGPDR